jgi:hypothetical protein
MCEDNRMSTENQSGIVYTPEQERVADSQSQMEALRVFVWECEKDWALTDRIDLATRTGRTS